MQTEKTQFQNNTGSYVGVTILTGKGDAKGISVEPHGKVWLTRDEQALTAQAPRRAEDNPFDPRSGERFGLTTGILTVCQESRVIGSERYVPAEASEVQDIGHAKAAALADEPTAAKPATPVAAQAEAAALEKRAGESPRVTPDDADPADAAQTIRDAATAPGVEAADPDAPAPEPVVEEIPEPTPVTPEPTPETPPPPATVPATDPVATSGLPTAPVPPEVAAGQDPAAREAAAQEEGLPPAPPQQPEPPNGGTTLPPGEGVETTAAQTGQEEDAVKDEGAEDTAQETVGTPDAQQSADELQAAAPASAEVSGALEDVGTPEAQQGDTAQQGDDPFPQAE